MREIYFIATNYAAFIIMLISLASMQTSLWLHFFGYFPAPYLWLTVINYWALNRSISEAVIICYLSTYILVTISSIPLSMGFLLNLSVFALIFSMRSRVLWSGANSFMLSCGVSALSVPFFTFVWSQIVEARPVRDFHFFDMVVSGLLTAATALPLYYLFVWIDHLTHKTANAESDTRLI